MCDGRGGNRERKEMSELSTSFIFYFYFLTGGKKTRRRSKLFILLLMASRPRGFLVGEGWWRGLTCPRVEKRLMGLAGGRLEGGESST